MEQRSTTDHGRDAELHDGTVADPRAELAVWLRAARAKRRMSVDDVARVTKIQPRFLERLEAGEIRCDGDGMPAEVFVRGFVRSFARCVGLDESEALERYTAIERGRDHALASGSGAVRARALVETMLWEPPAEAAPEPAPEPLPLESTALAVEAPKKKRAPRKKTTTGAPSTRSRKKKVTAPPEASVEVAPPPLPVIDEPVAVSVSAVEPEPEPDPDPALEPAPAPVPTVAETWKPTMPPPPVAPTVPWRRPSFVSPPTLPALPSLVIDDADPDHAERIQQARAREHRRTFLPPILLDRSDRSASGSQRGLTLAVIILLVAATLTLSYLMRRPSSSGDGVTRDSRPALIELA
jgi:hypothetical protein